MNKKVVVAMSGGVDSSVAAALLKRQNYEVIGVFCKFWTPPAKSNCKKFENLCCNQDSLLRARAVAQKLKIPFYVLDLSKEFKKDVVDYFIADYYAGRTPNPCVVCNQKIKFGRLFEKAKKLGADYLATGHYARLKDNKMYLSKDKTKDQTYFLWALEQEQLSKIIFPVGDYSKIQVRQMAKKWGLPSAQTHDSQAICFIPDRDVVGFLKSYLKKLKEGDIVDIGGKKIGKHEGLPFYTIGQRTKLGIQPNIPDFPPKYVIAKNTAKNQLVVGGEKDLYQKELIAEKINRIDPDPSSSISAKIRYGQQAQKCRLEKISKQKIKVVFEEPQRAITPGQSIVFYSGKELLGGGIIGEISKVL